LSSDEMIAPVHLRPISSIAAWNRSHTCPLCSGTHVTGHPVIRSAEPGEDWKYCYLDGEWAE
jgi:hypothetical protein